MAPYKEELKDKDIVFLYFASPSSPFDQWMHYTVTVPGEHYYLTEEQNDYLSEKVWGTGGVPKYAIYSANGTQLYKQVGWGGLDRIKPEIEKAKDKVQRAISKYRVTPVVEVKNDGPHFPYPSGPREYQKLAFQNWKANNSLIMNSDILIL